jgi:hypothetical protein
MPAPIFSSDKSIQLYGNRVKGAHCATLNLTIAGAPENRGFSGVLFAAGTPLLNMPVPGKWNFSEVPQKITCNL